MTGRARRLLAVPLAAMALLLPAAPASSSIAIIGFTWYSDGTYTKSGPTGTLITAYAVGARPNKPFRLQTSAIRGGFACSDVLVQDVNPNVRMSTNGGIIGYTSGPITLPVGNYELCFYETPRLPSGHSPSATAPAYFAVV